MLTVLQDSLLYKTGDGRIPKYTQPPNINVQNPTPHHDHHVWRYEGHMENGCLWRSKSKCRELATDLAHLLDSFSSNSGADLHAWDLEAPLAIANASIVHTATYFTSHDDSPANPAVWH